MHTMATTEEKECLKSTSIYNSSTKMARIKLAIGYNYETVIYNGFQISLKGKHDKIEDGKC